VHDRILQHLYLPLKVLVEEMTVHPYLELKFLDVPETQQFVLVKLSFQYKINILYLILHKQVMLAISFVCYGFQV
jgi:hypothetical protein